jgi:ABC-type amino acid transport substrate-binding protein
MRSLRAPSRRLGAALVAWALVGFGAPTQGASAEGDPSAAASISKAAPRMLRVATYDDPPFSMKDASGQWTGLAIELWHEVADRMGVDYEITGYDPPQRVYDLLAEGQVDVAAGALPVTRERVEAFEFSSTFLSKHYSIATAPREDAGWTAALGGPMSSRLRDVMLATLALFLSSALVIWWIERRRNPGHFGGGVTRGIGNGLWWSAATMTTVGYGDRTPVTIAGRFFAVFVMFLSLVLVSITTGIIASRLTVVEMRAKITVLGDLSRVRVGVMRGSPVAGFLTEHAIPYAMFPDIERAVEALVEGELDAVVGGEAELRYLADRRFQGRIALVPGAIDQGFVAFGLPTASPLRREINASLLGVLESGEWPRLRREYLRR